MKSLVMNTDSEVVMRMSFVNFAMINWTEWIRRISFRENSNGPVIDHFRQLMSLNFKKVS